MRIYYTIYKYKYMHIRHKCSNSFGYKGVKILKIPNNCSKYKFGIHQAV